ncbi:hypothetical protein EAE96_008102 [Botrytis aclada]|nr:hypothetical protein EAE96_008102 [Botrytis aclada]
MESQKRTSKQKAKAPALPSPPGDAIATGSFSTPTRTMPLNNSSNKIKLQLKNGHPNLPTAPSMGAPVNGFSSSLTGAMSPVDDSSSSPTGAMPPTNRSSKIKLQLKNGHPTLPTTPSMGGSVNGSSLSLTGAMPPSNKPTKLKIQLKNKSAAVTSSNGNAADDNSSSSAFARTERMPSEVPSKMVTLKLPSAKLATLCSSTQVALAGPSLKPTSSSSNLASSAIMAPPLPIAETSAHTFSSRGRLIRRTSRAEQGGPSNNAVAQNAGQKRKATQATTSSSKRVRTVGVDEAQNENIAAAAPSSGTPSLPVRRKARASKVHAASRQAIREMEALEEARRAERELEVREAARQALARGHLHAWLEESEDRTREARRRMGIVLRDWTALEEQREREAEQANTGALEEQGDPEAEEAYSEDL